MVRVALLALGLGCTQPKAVETDDDSGDSGGDTDTGGDDTASDDDPLVIIGGGVSGLMVALTAGHGVIYELDAHLGGRARWATGLFTCVGCPEQLEAGTTDSVETAMSEWAALTGAEGTDTTEAVLDASDEVVERVKGYGVPFEWFSKSTSRGTPRLVSVASAMGSLPEALAAALPAEVEVHLETRVERVEVVDGRAVGVYVDGAFVPASAVVIASGGFAGNSEVLASVLGAPDGTWFPSPVEGAAGDALQWAEGQGWSVSRTDAVGWGYGTMAGLEGDERPINLSFDPDGLHPWIFVDDTGRRFYDETIVWSLVTSTLMHEPASVWGLSPEETLLTALKADEVERWDAMLADGTRALCSSDLTTLAASMGVDAAGLEAELAAITATIAGAEDPFGRPADSLVPYEGLSLCAWRPARIALKTFGGLDVDERGRVIGGDGAVIEGLYAVGEAAGMAAPGTGGAYGFDGSLVAVTWSGWRVGTELAR